MIRHAILVLTTLTGAALADPVAVLDSRYTWPQNVQWFGGFSGFEILPDGVSIWVVSDAGFGADARILRDEDGHIIGAEGYKSQWLQKPDGTVVEGIENDAEGLALAPDGSLYVSFEGKHRIWRYAHVDPDFWAWAGSELIEPHKDFKGLQNNSSLEALAVAPDGAILTIPERSGVLTRPFPVYRYRDGAWDTKLSVPRKPPYLVSGADFGPDGKLYVLERHLNGIFGFQTRVRRFDYGEDTLTNEVTLIESRTGQHDNLEGIGVWRGADGDIRITMLSDNNFKSFQRTELVEYRVTE